MLRTCVNVQWGHEKKCFKLESMLIRVADTINCLSFPKLRILNCLISDHPVAF